MRYATLFFVLFALLALSSGCRTVTKNVPVETVRTEYREADTTAIFNRLLRIFESRREKEIKSDSLVDRTKETIVLNEKGDTTRHDKEHTVYKSTQREKELESENKTLKDSLSALNTRLQSIKTDSVPSIVPVEREMSRWEKVKMDAGGFAIGVAGALLVGIILLGYYLISHRKNTH